MNGPALIFDMDGVIVHSTPVHNRAWQMYLRRHFIFESLSHIEVSMLGKHNDDIVRIFFGEDTSAEECVRHGVEKEKVYRELMGPCLEEQAVAGVREFVRKHRDLPLAVATNAETANVQFVLEGLGLRPYFQVVVDGQDSDRPKPDPDVYFKAAARLGVPPAECIIFEDSETGVTAARATGARVVGLTTTAPELPNCDLTIADFRDPALEAWLSE